MKKILTLISITIASFWPKFFCQAQNLKDAFGSNLEKVGGNDGAGYDTSVRTIDPIIGNVIMLITSFLGVIFLALMLYAGFTWMTAGGDEKKVTKASGMMVAAIIGLIIVAAAYAITYFVFTNVVSQTLAI